MNSKGFVDNPMMMGVFIVVIVFAFALTGFLFFPSLVEFNDDFQNDTSLGNTSKSAMQDITDRYDTWQDGATAMLLVLLTLVLAILAYFTGTHPVLLIVVILVFIAMLMVAPALANAWDELAGSDDYSVYRSNFPITNFVMNNYLLVFVVQSIIIGFAMYQGGKGR